MCAPPLQNRLPARLRKTRAAIADRARSGPFSSSMRALKGFGFRNHINEKMVIQNFFDYLHFPHQRFSTLFKVSRGTS
jgi:hypothetical protein